MSKSKFYFTVLQIVALSLTISCSNSEDSEEKNVIKKTTDKIAQGAVESIKKPINKANNVEVLSNDRAREIKEATKQE